MALVKAGYWQTTYWSSSYWQEDYWLEYGTYVPPTPPAVTPVSREPPRRVRKRVKPMLHPSMLHALKRLFGMETSSV